MLSVRADPTGCDIHFPLTPEVHPVTDETLTTTHPPSQAAAGTGARDRLAVRLLLISTFVVILNETIMGVALPRLMSDLDIPASTAQWVTTAFMLTMAIVIPVTGFVIQRFTTRAVFLAAMTLFSLGTAICALAPGFDALIVGRVVQACGTAIMLPLLMTTVMTVTPPASRGRTMGNISIVISVAPAIGPTISGLVLSVLDWRWLFALVLPIALGALALGAIRLPNLTETRSARVDVGSVILSAVAFGGIVYGLSGLGRRGDHRHHDRPPGCRSVPARSRSSSSCCASCSCRRSTTRCWTCARSRRRRSPSRSA